MLSDNDKNRWNYHYIPHDSKLYRTASPCLALSNMKYSWSDITRYVTLQILTEQHQTTRKPSDSPDKSQVDQAICLRKNTTHLFPAKKPGLKSVICPECFHRWPQIHPARTSTHCFHVAQELKNAVCTAKRSQRLRHRLLVVSCPSTIQVRPCA
jgi:hypothetical protein